MSPSRTTAGWLLLTVAAALVGPGSYTGVGHATGMSVATARLSTFRPPELPASCPPSTVIAGSDTWVNEAQSTSNFGTRVALSVNARSTRRARVLLHFTLPAAPPGCALIAANLRVYNATATATRTVSVFRANAAWTELGVTWDTQPGLTGTGVNAAAAVGWMQWTVTDHVNALYSGTNTGFVLRDSLEDGANPSTQAFDSREATNKPELVLQWG